MDRLHHSTYLEEVGWARLLASVEGDLELSVVGVSWVRLLASVEGDLELAVPDVSWVRLLASVEGDLELAVAEVSWVRRHAAVERNLVLVVAQKLFAWNLEDYLRSAHDLLSEKPLVKAFGISGLCFRPIVPHHPYQNYCCCRCRCCCCHSEKLLIMMIRGPLTKRQVIC